MSFWSRIPDRCVNPCCRQGTYVRSGNSMRCNVCGDRWSYSGVCKQCGQDVNVLTFGLCDAFLGQDLVLEDER